MSQNQFKRAKNAEVYALFEFGGRHQILLAVNGRPIRAPRTQGLYVKIHSIEETIHRLL